jgi:hypothetical protein
MGVPASKVGYTSVTTGREKVHDAHVVALEEEEKEEEFELKFFCTLQCIIETG